MSYMVEVQSLNHTRRFATELEANRYAEALNVHEGLSLRGISVDIIPTADQCIVCKQDADRVQKTKLGIVSLCRGCQWENEK